MVSERPCQLAKQLYVALHHSDGVRSLDLDDDPPAPRQHRSVDLTDRRGGYRLPFERLEQALQGQPQVFFHHRPRQRVWERRHVVLKVDQFGYDLRRQQVGACAEQLAELHECGPQLLEHLAEMAAYVSRRRRHRDPLQVQNMPEVIALEEKAEAVSDRDFRDLANTLEVARTRDEGWRP